MNDTLYVLLSKPRVDGVFKFQMSRESLVGFIFRHRFHMRDVLELGGCSLQDFELTKLFPRNQWMSWHFGGDELAELNRALDRLLKRRTEYPKTGAYLQGREFPPSDRHDDAT